jgi:hypothetical protein
MQQTWWLDCPRPAALLPALLRSCPDGGVIALEGDIAALKLLVGDVPGATVGRALPFKPEWDTADDKMILLTVTPVTRSMLVERLVRNGAIPSEIGALQIAFEGAVQFLAGDNFHSECLSVGPGYSTAVLQELKDRGTLAGFYSRDEALQRIRVGQWSV